MNASEYLTPVIYYSHVTHLHKLCHRLKFICVTGRSLLLVLSSGTSCQHCRIWWMLVGI